MQILIAFLVIVLLFLIGYSNFLILYNADFTPINLMILAISLAAFLNFIIKKKNDEAIEEKVKELNTQNGQDS